MYWLVLRLSVTKPWLPSTMCQCSIPDLFRVDDHCGALGAFTHISEWRFRRIIGLWIKTAMILHPRCPVLCTIYIKEVEKVTTTWMLWAVQFFPISEVNVACLLAWGWKLWGRERNCFVGHKNGLLWKIGSLWFYSFKILFPNTFPEA